MKVVQKQGNNFTEIDVENLIIEGRPLKDWITEINKMRKEFNLAEACYRAEATEAKRLWNELKK
jgi:hypothetical protein